jgi:hypothetical protein
MRSDSAALNDREEYEPMADRKRIRIELLEAQQKRAICYRVLKCAEGLRLQRICRLLQRPMSCALVYKAAQDRLSG